MSTPPGPTPDLAGFANAQANLRKEFGSDVRFYGPAAMLYDPSIPASEFDDEGIPLDPLAGASAVASANVGIANLTLIGSAHCNVVFHPLQTSILRRDETYETPEGIRSGVSKDLILDPADYPLASGAVYYEIGTNQPDGSWVPEDGSLWKITNVQHDRFGSAERVIVYGQDTR